MTKQEKFLLLVVLLVSGVGATVYVQNQSSKQPSTGVIEQVQVVQTIPTTTPTPTNTVVASDQVTPNNTNTKTEIPTSGAVSTKNTQVSYGVPNGDTENLSVTVTTNNGLISDVSFAMTPTNRESGEYYQKFSSKFSKNLLIGKPLSGASVARVGGASLTTNAFNKALSQL